MTFIVSIDHRWYEVLPRAFQFSVVAVCSWFAECFFFIMIDEVENVRIPPYQSFDTLSLVRSEREEGNLGRSHVMFFGEDLLDSPTVTKSEASKKVPTSAKGLKVHEFLSSDSSWASAELSDSKIPSALDSSKNPKISRSKTSFASAFFTDEMTPEFAFTQYQRRSEDQACQVCGQPSVGFHHRAYVCEACKVIF